MNLLAQQHKETVQFLIDAINHIRFANGSTKDADWAAIEILESACFKAQQEYYRELLMS